jgi:LmbE family N-acetylglucosaminyl deacetylase
VHVVIVTDGTGSHPHSLEYPAARLKAVRRDERPPPSRLGLPPGRLSFFDYRDSASPANAALQDAAQLGRIVSGRSRRYSQPGEHDPHPDHVSAHRIAALGSGIAGFRLMSYAVWAGRCRQDDGFRGKPSEASGST